MPKYFLPFLTLFLLLIPLANADAPTPLSIAQDRATAALTAAAASLKEAVSEAQAVPITPAPPPLVIQPTTTSMIRDGLVSVASIFIPGLIALGLAWMSSHLKVMKDLGMNQAVTTSAYGFGGLLVQALQKTGTPLNSLNPGSPEVLTLANTLIKSYPAYTAKLGLNESKAAVLVLKGAALASPPASPTLPNLPTVFSAAPSPSTMPVQPGVVPPAPAGVAIT